MPLRIVAPRKSPYYSIRGTYLGIRVDRSAKTGKRALAVKLLRKIEREIESGSYAIKGEPTFAEAARDYMNAGGERTYLRKLLEHFGDKPLREINQSAIDAAAPSLYPRTSAATLNRQVYSPISAILRSSGVFLHLRRPRGAQGQKKTAWLWPEQAQAIFAEAEKINKDLAALLIVLCYTGMRLSEALNLTWGNVRLADGCAFLPRTKNGNPRAVFLPPVAVSALANLPKDRNRVFPFAKGGHLYSIFRLAGIRAGVELPERSAFHILRHTFATWMRRYAGADEKTLIATGAWKDRKSVDRYTHAVVSEESRLAATPWPERERIRWLKTVSTAVDLIYGNTEAAPGKTEHNDGV